MDGRLARSRMRTRGVLLWTAMSILAVSSSSRVINAQGVSARQRAGEGFKVKEQQVGLVLKGAGRQWRISAGEQRASRDGNDVAQRCAADLFALFGGHVAASAVEEARAKELLKCVRVLAPALDFPPLDCHCDSEQGFLTDEEQELRQEAEQQQQKQPRISQLGGKGRGERDFRMKIASPPAAVKELARRTVEWSGDPTVILNALGAESYPVPDVEGSAEERCTLTKYDDGRRFAKQVVTEYMAFLFEAVTELAPSVGLNISLNRFDLFHGHMFTTYNTGRLGILFHSKEYPAYDDKKFPFNLGFCQKGSSLPYDASMALRNIVWLAPMPDCSPVLDSSNQTCSVKWLAPGSLFVLDTSEGKILARELVPSYLDVVHTVSEDDLGDVMLDVNYFSLPNKTPEERVFLC